MMIMDWTILWKMKEKDWINWEKNRAESYLKVVSLSATHKHTHSHTQHRVWFLFLFAFNAFHLNGCFISILFFSRSRWCMSVWVWEGIVNTFYRNPSTTAFVNEQEHQHRQKIKIKKSDEKVCLLRPRSNERISYVRKEKKGNLNFLQKGFC